VATAAGEPQRAWHLPGFLRSASWGTSGVLTPLISAQVVVAAGEPQRAWYLVLTGTLQLSPSPAASSNRSTPASAPAPKPASWPRPSSGLASGPDAGPRPVSALALERARLRVAAAAAALAASGAARAGAGVARSGHRCGPGARHSHLRGGQAWRCRGLMASPWLSSPGQLIADCRHTPPSAPRRQIQQGRRSLLWGWRRWWQLSCPAAFVHAVMPVRVADP